MKPGDEGAAAEHARLAEEVAALDRCLLGHEKERTAIEEELDRLKKQAEGLREQDARLERQIDSERSRIEAWRAESDRDRADAPEPWRVAFDSAGEEDLSAWETERDALEVSGVRHLAAELPQAKMALKRAEAAVSDLEGRIAGIPEESRREPKDIAATRAEAGVRLKRAEDDRLARQGELHGLRRDEAARRDLEASLREAEGKLATAETLARLLGREGLQRVLLRDAERGILEAANPILGEISGGELQLRLAEGEDEDDEPALALEALVRTHGQTRVIGVPFLSGSQEFRVSVSLALGIGQFARGSDRPIQAVIIDEGFGCLDRQGRDEMIVEMNALKGRLARIILVSHQEEFAESFADGYRFEIVDGATRVEPFHR
jgi:DNA repair exonuclease SbcCD ATPase subunit